MGSTPCDQLLIVFHSSFGSFRFTFCSLLTLISSRISLAVQHRRANASKHDCWLRSQQVSEKGVDGGRLVLWFTPAADFFWIFNATRLEHRQHGWSRLRESDKLLRVSYATSTSPVVYILTFLPRAIRISLSRRRSPPQFCRNLRSSTCRSLFHNILYITPDILNSSIENVGNI